MNEKTILRIAISTSLVGVLFLLILCNVLELPLTFIGDLDESFLDENVRVEGKVEKVLEKSNVIMFDLVDNTGRIKVIIFTDEGVDLENYVDVEGTVMEYKGELEINAERIERVS